MSARHVAALVTGVVGVATGASAGASPSVSVDGATMTGEPRLVYVGIDLRGKRPTDDSEIDTENTTDLFVVRTTGSGTRRLTRTAASESDPAWSPDGGRIAFSSGFLLCHANDCAGPVSGDIWVMAADGSAPTRVTAGAAQDLLDTSPSWSPDGQRLAFVRGLPGMPGAGIYVVAANGSDLRRLAARPAVAADWSPDGNSVVYVADTRNRAKQLVVVDVQAGRASTLAIRRLPADVLDAAWSPDGSHLAVTTAAAGVFAVPARGGVARRIVGPGYGDVAWSPDGRRLVVVGPWPLRERSHLYVVRNDGTGLRRVTSAPRLNYAPDWRR